MAEKLKIIPLGGLNEIGKNMTVYEYGGELIVVDCGMGFPDDEMPGVDFVIPGNDDASKAVALYAAGMADAILDGREASEAALEKEVAAEEVVEEVEA